MQKMIKLYSRIQLFRIMALVGPREEKKKNDPMLYIFSYKAAQMDVGVSCYLKPSTYPQF